MPGKSRQTSDEITPTEKETRRSNRLYNIVSHVRSVTRAASRTMSKIEATYQIGDVVETLVALPGIPIYSVGRVKEVGHLFLAVELDDGRLGYYSARQLRKQKQEKK